MISCRLKCTLKDVFHNDSFTIQIERLSQTRLDSCAVLRINGLGQSNNKLFYVNSILSMKAIINLDGWIQYYRSKPEGACTTRDTVVLRWMNKEDNLFLLMELKTVDY